MDQTPPPYNPTKTDHKLGRGSGCSSWFNIVAIVVFAGAICAIGLGDTAILAVIAVSLAAFSLYYREERELEAERWKRLFELLDKQD
jgi:uncharacterized membrane protein